MHVIPSALRLKRESLLPYLLSTRLLFAPRSRQVSVALDPGRPSTHLAELDDHHHHYDDCYSTRG